MRKNGDGDFGRRSRPDQGRGRSILDQAGSLPIEGQELRRHLKRSGVAFGQDTSHQITKLGGFEDTDETTVALVGGNVSLGIATGFAEFSYYTDGDRYTSSSSMSVAHGTTEGTHYIYLDGADLKTSTELTGDILSSKTLVASVYYDATNAVVIQFSDLRRETNVAFRPPKLGVTSQYGAELDIVHTSINGTGTSDDDARVEIDSYNAGSPDVGMFWEGDRLHLVVDGEGQYLNRQAAEIPVYYREAGGWRRQAQSDLHVVLGAGGRPNWNEFNGTSWVQSEAASGSNILMHYIAVPNADEPVICVMGIREYDTASPGEEDAAFEIDALHLNGLTDLLPVWFMFGTVEWQVDSSYTNSVKARLISNGAWGNYRDWRNYDQIGASLIEATRGGLITNGDYTVSTNGVLAGRDTSGAGDLEEISVGSGLSLSSATLAAEVTQVELDAVDTIADQGVADAATAQAAADAAQADADTNAANIALCPYVLSQIEEQSQVGASSTAFHEVFSFTVPANALGAKGRVMIEYELAHHGQTGNSKHQWKLNGTVVYGSKSGGQPPADSNERFILGRAYVANNNSSGQQRGGESMHITDQGTSNAGTGGHWWGDGRGSGHFDNGVEDTRSDMTISLEVGFVSSDASNYFQLISAICTLYPSV